MSGDATSKTIAYHRLRFIAQVIGHVSPTFPALANGCTFSRAWEGLHIFPSLTPVTCFPAFDNSHVFPHTSTVFRACFGLTSVWFVALFETLRDNLEFGSIFEESRNHKHSWQFPQFYYLFSLTSRERQTSS